MLFCFSFFYPVFTFSRVQSFFLVLYLVQFDIHIDDRYKEVPMTINEEAIQSLITASRLIHSETDFQRIPMQAENMAQELIRTGQYDRIHFHPFSQMQDNLGIMARDARTQYTYIVVASVTVWSRIAIEQGVVPDDAFDLSDALLYSLSLCQTLEEIHDIYELSAVMFAKQVHQILARRPSRQIAEVQNYISRNIFKKITLKEIADYMNLTPNYLSSLFSQELHISIHNYIQREKIHVSCNLLSHTKQSVSDISAYMGFQTQSNFSAVFRKWESMTPTEYREKNYREVY